MTSLPRAVATIAAALLYLTVARSASVDINPVRIDLVGEGVPTELRLTNTGATELSVQVDTLQWVQDLDGADRLIETQELLAVPPVFSIAPGQRQIVRIGFLGEQKPELEQSFRLLVTELAPESTDEIRPSSLSMRMRFSIPAFVTPSTGAASPDIVLREVNQADGTDFVRLANVGNGHVKLGRVELLGSEGWKQMPETTTAKYMLPGASLTLAIPPDTGELSAIRISSIDGRDWEYVVQSSR